MQFTSLDALAHAGVRAAMDKYERDLSLEMTSVPVLKFRFMGDGGKTLLFMTKFLKFAISFA